MAIELISEHIATKLKTTGRGLPGVISKTVDKSNFIPQSVRVLHQTTQIQAIHTSLRDKHCPRDEFIFLATRLARLLIEEALDILPFESVSVTTPTQSVYEGNKSNVKVNLFFFFPSRGRTDGLMVWTWFAVGGVRFAEFQSCVPAKAWKLPFVKL